MAQAHNQSLEGEIVFGYEDMLQEKIDMLNTKRSKEKYLILKFFENHPEIIGQTCKNCVNKEQTCAEQLLELFEKLE